MERIPASPSKPVFYVDSTEVTVGRTSGVSHVLYHWQKDSCYQLVGPLIWPSAESVRALDRKMVVLSESAESWLRILVSEQVLGIWVSVCCRLVANSSQIWDRLSIKQAHRPWLFWDCSSASRRANSYKLVVKWELLSIVCNVCWCLASCNFIRFITHRSF